MKAFIIGALAAATLGLGLHGVAGGTASGPDRCTSEWKRIHPDRVEECNTTTVPPGGSGELSQTVTLEVLPPGAVPAPVASEPRFTG